MGGGWGVGRRTTASVTMAFFFLALSPIQFLPLTLSALSVSGGKREREERETTGYEPFEPGLLHLAVGEAHI